MTAPEQPEPGKHCEHEHTICKRYCNTGNFDIPCDGRWFDGEKCQHDTRQRNVIGELSGNTRQLNIPINVIENILGILFLVATGGKVESEQNMDDARDAHNIIAAALRKVQQP